jgi:L-iditol 2-dehydrogenase
VGSGAGGALPRDERFDLVVEVVGTAEAWQHSLAAVAPGGRVHFFGGPPAGTKLPIDADRLHYEELTLTASFHHTPGHFAKALGLLADGFVDPELLLEPPMALDDVPAWLSRPRRTPRKGVVHLGTQGAR